MGRIFFIGQQQKYLSGKNQFPTQAFPSRVKMKGIFHL